MATDDRDAAASLDAANPSRPADPPAETSGNGAEPATDDYVPMSEWLDDLDA